MIESTLHENSITMNQRQSDNPTAFNLRRKTMNLKTIQTITLDLTVHKMKNVRCVEDDRQSRIINILVTNNGETYPLDPASMAAVYKIHKPDHTYIFNNADINDDGTVTITLPDQAMAVPGILHSALQVSKNGAIISTMPFHIIVEQSVYSNKDIESQNESDVLGDMVRHLNDYENPHKIPIASASIPGLVKSGTDITVDDNGNVSVNDNSHNHVANNISDLDLFTQTKISNHNTSSDAHNDIRSLITALTAVVGNKVDKISGKGLSSNDYTTEEKSKLNGIASGAEVNVQADWDITDSESDAYIKNKPTIPTKTSQLVNDSGFTDNYTHPDTHPANIIIQDENHRFVTDSEKDAWNNKLDKTDDTQNNTITFISGDSATANEWTDVSVLTSQEKHGSILTKISTMFKNIRYLYKMLGTTDISAINGGTVTGAISGLNTRTNILEGLITTRYDLAPGAQSMCTVQGWRANVGLLVTRHSLFYIIKWSASVNINPIVDNGDVEFLSVNGNAFAFYIKNKATTYTNYFSFFW